MEKSLLRKETHLKVLLKVLLMPFLVSLILMPCQEAVAQTYCNPTYSSQGNSWRISQFNVPEVSYTYSISSYTPTDHTSEIITVSVGASYTFQITTNGWVGVGVAADFNNDGDFDDTDELLAAPTYIASDPATYNYMVTIPNQIPAGDYRLRLWNVLANSGNGTPLESPCGSYVYGTFADFTLSIENNDVCEAPTNLILDDITDTTAGILWDASPNEIDGYNWVVMADGDNPDSDTPVQSGSVATGVTDVELTGLMANTNYDFYVSTVCDAGLESDWEGPLSFTTNEEVCEAPTTLVVDEVTESTVNVSWVEPTFTDNIAEYTWAIVLEGDDPFDESTIITEGNLPLGTTSHSISGLNPETAYDFYLASVCGNENFSDLIMETFVTETLSIGENVFTHFSFYPNPANANITLNSNGFEIKEISVVDIHGRELLFQKPDQANTILSIAHLPVGVYFLRISISENTKVYKLIKR